MLLQRNMVQEKDPIMKFFIRTGAATRELKGRDLIDYQKKVFD